MIFPDKETIRRTAVENYFYEDVRESFKIGAQWAINHIKENASDGFEDFWLKNYDKCGKYTAKDDAQKIWQTATIVAKVRHQEEIKAKDAEIGRLGGLASLHHSREYQHRKELKALRLENKAVKDVSRISDEMQRENARLRQELQAKDAEIARLKEYEFMYKGLEK